MIRFAVRPLRTTGSRAKGQQHFILGVTVPTILYAGLLGLFPVLWALLLMFFDYSPQRAGGGFLGLGGNNPFVGLLHFQNMFVGTDLPARMFRQSLFNTLVFAFAYLPLNLLITLPLASLIESVTHGVKGIFRGIYFLPAVTTSVGVATIWRFMYEPRYGLVNSMITGLGGRPIAFLTDPHREVLGMSIALWAVILAYLWQDYGYNLVIFIAALQNIPKELKEAAMIDGAGFWDTFRHITLPLLRPTVLFVCVMTMISSFQVFDIIQVMTGGGPNNMTRVLQLDIYQNAFRFQNMGWAAAVSFVLLTIVLTITLVQMRLLRTDWEY